MPAPFQQIGEQHLLYTQSHIYWLVVNMVLDGVAFYVGCGPKHVVVILFHHFAGLDFEMPACFQVDKFRRAVVEIELNLLRMMERVEQQHLVFAMAQMAEGIHQRVSVGGFYQRVGEYHHHGAAVKPFGGKVQGLCDLCSPVQTGLRGVLLAHGGFAPQFGFEYLQQVLLEGTAAAAVGLQVDALAQQRQPESVALPYQQLGEHGGSITGKGQLVGMAQIALPLGGQEHGAAMVDHQLATQIGLLLVAFYEQLVGTAVEFPVDIASRLALRVLSMFSKLDRETMKRTSMQTGDESLHRLACIEIQRLVSL